MTAKRINFLILNLNILLVTNYNILCAFVQNADSSSLVLKSPSMHVVDNTFSITLRKGLSVRVPIMKTAICLFPLRPLHRPGHRVFNGLFYSMPCSAISSAWAMREKERRDAGWFTTSASAGNISWPVQLPSYSSMNRMYGKFLVFEDYISMEL